MKQYEVHFPKTWDLYRQFLWTKNRFIPWLRTGPHSVTVFNNDSWVAKADT